jgi:antitoxin HicB
MKKTLEYYLGLGYTRELIPELSGIWFARIKELPNCMSQGNTPEAALRNLDEAMVGWIKGELEDGDPIPEPREEDEYSGKFNTRVPKSIHRKLVEAAERDRVSLNQWINTALAEAVGISAAQIPARSEITEETDQEFAWPGLEKGIRFILSDVGMGHKAGILDEQLFAAWIEQNLEEFKIDYQQNDYRQALSNARALSTFLEAHQNRSPVIRIIYKMVIDQTLLLNLVEHMQQSFNQTEQIQAQISAIISNVNSPTLDRIREREDERHSTTTSPREAHITLRDTVNTSEW